MSKSKVHLISIPFRSKLAIAAAFALAILSVAAASYCEISGTRKHDQQSLGERAAAAASMLDLKFEGYRAILGTLAETEHLGDAVDLKAFRSEAQRLAERFDGWFFLVTDGPVGRVLVDTDHRYDAEGVPPMVERSLYPEIMAVEAENLRTGKPAISNVFNGRYLKQPMFSIAQRVDSDQGAGKLLYFTTTSAVLSDLLSLQPLEGDEFLSVTDASERVVARSSEYKTYLFRPVPRWIQEAKAGRDHGVVKGPPISQGADRLFAFQKLSAAAGWTVVISAPFQSAYEILISSRDVALMGLFSILELTAIVGLVLSKAIASERARAAQAQAEQLETLLGEVRTAEQSKFRKLAELCHELRSPLVAQLSGMDLLVTDTLHKWQRDIVDRARDEGHRMLHLIDDVLEAARVGRRPLGGALGAVRMDRIVGQVEELVRPLADRRGLQLNIRVDDGADNAFIGDEKAIRRILLNLVTNAIKFTPEGKVSVVAACEWQDENKARLCVSVADTGVGIAQNDRERLFDDFGILEATRHMSPNGAGLGLAISRRLARSMGGEIDLESTVGLGSTFTFVLLVEFVPFDTAAPVAESSAVAGSHPVFGRLVLVAEDHDLIRIVTCRSLEELGALTVQASDGEEAVRLASKTDFDLILMDLKMPVMDGTDAATAIRTGSGLSKNTTMIGLTAHQNPVIAHELSGDAFETYMTKPFDAAVLANHLTRLWGEAAPNRDMSIAAMNQREYPGIGSDFAGAYATELLRCHAEISECMATSRHWDAATLAHRTAGVAATFGHVDLARNLLCIEADLEAGRIQSAASGMTKLPQLIERALNGFAGTRSGASVDGGPR